METSRFLLIIQQVEEAMLLNEITCNLFYTPDQSAEGLKETKVGAAPSGIGGAWRRLTLTPRPFVLSA